ncbi:hypothetical protein RQP54_15020 [Curvibacter sp. APW13]|uniref:hypothetical protein n=1 Tax=Curvibacter sp. APW13 TaxID=3077236 RepID=UPI0028DE8DD0|nr:hypothetical protein [Curvibacter sp. APW13]MDT8992182.1 hypothetical protein [Curvibacter sp. APW13]
MHASVEVSPRRRLQGLDWVLLRLMPVLGFAALLIPLAGVLANRGLRAAGVAQARLEVMEFWWMGATVVYWSVFMTALVGCSIAWAFRYGRRWLFTPPSDESR